MSGIASSSPSHRYPPHFPRNANPNEDANGIDYVIANYDELIAELQEYPAKHIINALTQIAEDIKLAPHIAPYLESKILNVPPRHKLPIFYLMDSIMKNIGLPYLIHFGRNIVRIFCACIDEAPPADIRKFEHVLNTWVEQRLFPEQQLQDMRKKLRDGPSARVQNPPSGVYDHRKPSNYAVSPTQFQQLSHQSISTEVRKAAIDPRRAVLDPRRTAPVDPRRMHTLPATDPRKPRSQIAGIQHYDRRGGVVGRQHPRFLDGRGRRSQPADAAIVYSSTGAGILKTPDDLELRQLLTKLQNEQNIPEDEHLSLEEIRTQNPSYYKLLLDYQTQQTPQVPARQFEPSGKRKMHPTKQVGVGAQLKPQEKRPRSTPSTVTHQARYLAKLVEKQHTVAPNINPVVVGDILKKLRGISNQNTVSMTAGSPGMNASNMSQQMAADTESTDTFKVAPAKERIEANVRALYGDLRFVCKQSGVRFRSQELLDAHLDFVFQYNRAQREKSKGTTSRSWYPTELQWETDFQGGCSNRGETSLSFFDLVEGDADNTEEFNTKSSVPADDAITKCRICGEAFTKFWDEEEEEWMFRNAVYGIVHNATPGGSKQRSVFHKHCYEAATANSSIIRASQLAPGTPQSPNVPSRNWSGAIEAAFEYEDSDDQNGSSTTEC